MRKLIFGTNVSLDGCCDHTKMVAGESVHEYFADLMRESDTLLYGRKTYELMVPFWPDIAKSQSMPEQSMNDFARAFDSVERIVVFSRTLDPASQSDKTEVHRGNLKDEVIKLKQGTGKAILLGGVDLPSQLVELDLIDEFCFVVHPVVVGSGRRLFDGLDLTANIQLKLIESTSFDSGHVALRYARQ
jgi:dihydrofolate reductase